MDPLRLLRSLRGARAVFRYAAAVGVVILVLSITAVLEPLTLRVPSAPLFAAVLTIAWLAGLGPATVATGLGVVALAYLADERGGAWLPHERDALWMGVFFLTALVMAWLASTVRRLEDERAELLARERAARTEAEAANRAKDDFLAMVSHELRRPLTAILAWTHVIRTGKPAPGEMERGLDTIDRNTRLQAKLVEDLLDVARAIAGKLDVTLRPVDVSRIAWGAVDTHRPPAQAAGVRLTTELTADVRVFGDGERLQQVIGNLLANAIKFTPAPGHVHLALTRDGERARIVVRDTGEGIAPELLPHVFDRFRQGEVGRRRPEGLGLGLAIVQYIVQAHGGVVRAESAGPGQGATFTVELPLA